MKESKIIESAIRELENFYKEFPNKIDRDELIVQIEDFTWENAIFRLDISHDVNLVFIPWRSNFVMAHRIWMGPQGEIVKSESIYRNENQSKIDTGFFPGKSFYADHLNLIDQALKSKSPFFENHLEFEVGLDELSARLGQIIELENHYEISAYKKNYLDSDYILQGKFIFDMDKKTGKLSNFREKFDNNWEAKAIGETYDPTISSI